MKISGAETKGKDRLPTKYLKFIVTVATSLPARILEAQKASFYLRYTAVIALNMTKQKARPLMKPQTISRLRQAYLNVDIAVAALSYLGLIILLSKGSVAAILPASLFYFGS